MRFIPDLGNALPLIVGATVAAALLSLALTPVIRRMAHRFDIVDRPEQRRVNLSPIPRGGGLAVAAAFLLVAALVVIVEDRFEIGRISDTVEASELGALLLGGLAAAGLGALDDSLQLRARWQLVSQVLLALVAVAFGLNVGFVNNPLGTNPIVFGGPVAAIITVVWIVGMINSINFIDGLDGLSSGIALIAASTLGLISLTTVIAQPFVAVLCFALAGALLGFLRWNFHPASIFVGTSGVMFIGYTLAVLSILGTAKVAVALLVLGVPIIDTFWIIVRRLASGRSPFTPDRGHIHHRLLDLGLSHRQTVLLIYAICLLLALLTFVLSGTGQLYAFVGIVLASGLVLFVLTRRSLVAEELAAESYAGATELDEATDGEATDGTATDGETAGPASASAAGSRPEVRPIR